MKNLIIIVACFLLTGCEFSVNSESPQSKEEAITQIDSLMNNWHRAAAEANLADYLRAMSKESIYIGTDASENWSHDAFEEFCKPYFDKKTTWSFKTIERNIYISADSKAAWFDELLVTQMGICRGSGTLEKEGVDWKIKHFVLSMTVPNDRSKEVSAIKAELEETFIRKLKAN